MKDYNRLERLRGKIDILEAYLGGIVALGLDADGIIQSINEDIIFLGCEAALEEAKQILRV